MKRHGHLFEQVVAFEKPEMAARLTIEVMTTPARVRGVVHVGRVVSILANHTRTTWAVDPVGVPARCS